MPKVLVPLADGFEEMEGIIIIDVLRRAQVEVVAAGLHAGPLTASRGTRHVPDALIDDVADQDFDMIVLPGGAEGARNLEAHPVVTKILVRMREQDRYIGAICAAPNVLRNHGIVSGDAPFVLHPATLQDGNGGRYVEGARLVRHGKITTSIGPGSAFEFALDLVEQLCGKETRDKVAAPMYLPGSRKNSPQRHSGISALYDLGAPAVKPSATRTKSHDEYPGNAHGISPILAACRRRVSDPRTAD